MYFEVIEIKASGNVSKQEMLEIHNSGLFFHKSELDNELKLNILKWYNNLSENYKNFVDILINEAIDNAEYFSNR